MLGGKLLIVWDGLPAHRSRAVWEFVRQQRGRIWLEFLPAYAPELNPTEYIWGHLKQHELANFCPKDLGELGVAAIRALKRMRRRPSSGHGLLATSETLSIVTILCNTQ